MKNYVFSIKVKYILYHRLIVKAKNIEEARSKATQYIQSNEDIRICEDSFWNEVEYGDYYECELSLEYSNEDSNNIH